jgi:hypothetical protein
MAKRQKNRQHNGQKKDDKRTNNDLHNTTHKTKAISSFKVYYSEIHTQYIVNQSLYAEQTIKFRGNDPILEYPFIRRITNMRNA